MADEPRRDYPNIPPEEPDSEATGSDTADQERQERREQELDAPQPGQENDGGESILSGRSRESGGVRPREPDERQKLP